jgi:RHS repeat-associated protein
MRFPGQYFDKETNLFYNYFRDYDPSIGRYGQSDPVGLMGGINTYLYANANALRFVDPMGLATICAGDPGKAFQDCMKKCDVRYDGDMGKCAKQRLPRRAAVCAAGATARYVICVAKCTAKYIPDLYDDDD